MDVISYSVWIKQNYPDVNIYIVYPIQYDSIYSNPNMDLIETSISFLSNSIADFGMHGIVRFPHPWYGKTRQKRIDYIVGIVNSFDNIQMENPCGCLTVTPNTNIYCCPFCSRRVRKKLFGNADRDKHVIGTIDRGVFRKIDCDTCKNGNSKSRCLKYEYIGGE